jgi:acetyl esterase/lipase
MKNKVPLFLTAGLALLALTTMAQHEVVPLWPAGKVPNSIPSTVEEKSVTSGGIMRISGVTVPAYTVYLPAADKATGAAVLVCPGGGYSILAAEHEGSDLAVWFQQRGIAAFVLKYRLPNPAAMTNQHEVPLLDAMQAMKLIRQNAAKYKIEATKLGVMGFSAGGHLAATLSTHFNKGAGASEAARPDFSILLYPVITFNPALAHGGSRDNLLGAAKSDELIRYYSNELQVDATTPPAFLVHAQDDTGVPVENSIEYYLALRKNKVPVEMHLYPRGGHGFALRTDGKGSVASWPVSMENWLRANGWMK